LWVRASVDSIKGNKPLERCGYIRVIRVLKTIGPNGGVVAHEQFRLAPALIISNTHH
jgi:hypothetical protein